MVRVAVIGGGFAGVYAIRALHRACKDLEIVLFEPREAFVFMPLLHEVAADVLHTPSVTHPYKNIFHRQVTHIKAKADEIDLKGKRIRANGTWHSYDYSLIAIGSRTARRPAHAFELKSIDDALAIRKAAHAAKDGDLFVIVGGGPTGVELSCELAQLFRYRGRKVRIALLQSHAHVLTGQPAKLQRIAERRLREQGIDLILKARVQAVLKEKVIVNVDGKKTVYATTATIWTAGVAPQAIKGFEEGYIGVARTLQVKGHPETFAAGDVSLMDPAVPNLAQAAVQQGTHAGRNIRRLINGEKPQAFAFKNRGFLISLGQKYGAASISGGVFEGFLPWFLWRTVYLVKFVGVRSRLRLAREYTVRLFRRA